MHDGVAVAGEIERGGAVGEVALHELLVRGGGAEVLDVGQAQPVGQGARPVRRWLPRLPAAPVTRMRRNSGIGDPPAAEGSTFRWAMVGLGGMVLAREA